MWLSKDQNDYYLYHEHKRSVTYCSDMKTRFIEEVVLKKVCGGGGGG